MSEYLGQHVAGPDPGRPAVQHDWMSRLCQQHIVPGVQHSPEYPGGGAQTQSMLAGETEGSLRLCRNVSAFNYAHSLCNKVTIPIAQLNVARMSWASNYFMLQLFVPCICDDDTSGSIRHYLAEGCATGIRQLKQPAILPRSRLGHAVLQPHPH